MRCRGEELCCSTNLSLSRAMYATSGPFECSYTQVRTQKLSDDEFQPLIFFFCSKKPNHTTHIAIGHADKWNAHDLKFRVVVMLLRNG